MTIELNDQSYIVGMWFSSDPKTENNWLACFIRDPENPLRFKGWSRFRYVKDDKVFDSDDEKSWSCFSSKEGESEQTVIDLMDHAQQLIKPGYPDIDRIIVQGDLEKLMELAEGKPWMNIKKVKASEHE